MRFNKVLWTVQVLLAALFLFAGVMKLVMPVDAMSDPVALPGAFLRFIGVAEVCGAVGLILPGLLRIKPGLTALAASCLVVIMAGAITITAAFVSLASATFPLVVGLLLSGVAVGRSQASPAAA